MVGVILHTIFCFSGVLAGYVEYQSLSLRGKLVQHLEVNKLVYNDEQLNCSGGAALLVLPPQKGGGKKIRLRDIRKKIQATLYYIQSYDMLTPVPM